MTVGGGAAVAGATTAAMMCMCIAFAEQQVVERRTVAADMAAAGANGESQNRSRKNKPDQIIPMKFSILLTRFPSRLSITLLAVASGILPAKLQAAEPAATPAPPAIAEQLFASPEEAVKALQAAVEAKDQTALQTLFGPEFSELQTGDRVQDANNARRFAAAMSQSCLQVKAGDDKITLEVGTNNWPYPIPLVKADGQWHFDTSAGKDEMINRHIGKDELCAIGVCRTYVIAQRQYASANSVPGGVVGYAQKFKSTPGKKNGLYWPAGENEAASPFGSLVAEAQAEGYVKHKGAGPHPFHGYYFKILTRQGEAAPGGKMNYMSDDSLTGGFALVAYPEHWDQSGIMTFIVNQDGKVFQRNFGEKTSRIAGAMKAYNPDKEWTLVPDEGVLNAASEQ
jgi:hypothetical protein